MWGDLGSLQHQRYTRNPVLCLGGCRGPGEGVERGDWFPPPQSQGNAGAAVLGHPVSTRHALLLPRDTLLPGSSYSSMQPLRPGEAQQETREHPACEGAARAALCSRWDTGTEPRARGHHGGAGPCQSLTAHGGTEESGCMPHAGSSGNVCCSPGHALQGHGRAPAAGAAAGGQRRWPPAAGGAAQEEHGGPRAQLWAAVCSAGGAAAGTGEPRGAPGPGAAVGALPVGAGAAPAGPAQSPPPLPALLPARGRRSPPAHRAGEPARGGPRAAPGCPVPGGGDRAGEGHAGRDGEQSQHPAVDGGGHAVGRDRQHHGCVRSGGGSRWALLQGALSRHRGGGRTSTPLAPSGVTEQGMGPCVPPSQGKRCPHPAEGKGPASGPSRVNKAPLTPQGPVSLHSTHNCRGTGKTQGCQAATEPPGGHL